LARRLPYSASSDALFPFVVGEAGGVARVTYTPKPLRMFPEIQPGVFVSPNVDTDFDFPLPRGSYLVEALDGMNYQFSGESLDLAFLMAAAGEHGVYSADVNPDFSLSRVLGGRRKLRAIKRLGLKPRVFLAVGE
jgi:hypothetical protein